MVFVPLRGLVAGLTTGALGVAFGLMSVGCDLTAGETGSGGGTGGGGCVAEDRAVPYEPGMTEEGAEGYAVVLNRSVSAPPAKGDNAWTIVVRDESGDPVDDLVVEVFPFMPDHGHGGSVQTQVRAGDASGTYILEPLNLPMAGYWEVRIDFGDGTTTLDEVMFPICVEE